MGPSEWEVIVMNSRHADWSDIIVFAAGMVLVVPLLIFGLKRWLLH
jgi:hypothetical protein